MDQLSQFRRHVEEAGVLAQRIPVGHAGNEIRNPAQTADFLARLGPPRPLGRHVLRDGAIMLEEIAHYAFRVAHDSGNARVPVHPRVQEFLDGFVGFRNACRKTCDRAARLAHIVGRYW